MRSHQAVKQFAARNADEINEAKRFECEDIELWATQKHDQFALIIEQAIEVRDRIWSGELSPSQEARYRTLLLKAVHQLSELTGLLRSEVGVKEFARHILEGVDIDRAFPVEVGDGEFVREPFRVSPPASRACI